MAFDWYDPKLHEGVAGYALERGWILNTHMTRTQQFPVGWRGDGVLGLINNDATRDFVKSLDLPTVDMGGHYPEFPQILCDNYRVGQLAAEHFLERNHKNFAFFHIQSSRLEREIFGGFSSTLEITGNTCESRYWHDKQGDQENVIDYQAVQTWVKQQVKDLPRPLAVFCQNDDTAALILSAIVEEGYHVPEEVAILGAGNSDLVCNFQPIQLSSIGSNLRGLANRLCVELDRILKGHAPRKTPVRVLPGRIHARQSTNFLAVSNPHVRRVLREIWEKCDQPLNVEKLTELVPISRSALYGLFIQEVGRPMARELMRIRIIKAKEMLAGTRLQVSEIGRRCGFTSPISFSRAFSTNAGMSAVEYRKSVLAYLKKENVSKDGDVANPGGLAAGTQ